LSGDFDPFPLIRDIVQGELGEQLTENRGLFERFGHSGFEVIHGQVIGGGVGSNLPRLISLSDLIPSRT
jgi:hypothetical protein